MAVGPTPIAVTHRLTVDVGVPGIRPHKFRLFCNAVSDGGDPDGFIFETPTTSIGMSTAVANLFGLLTPLYPNTVSIGAVVLDQYFTGSWIPVGSDPTSTSGTGGGPINSASQVTTTARDASGKIAKTLIFETIYAPPVRWTAKSSVPTALGLFVQNWNENATGSIGSWARFRNADYTGLATFISTTITLNRRLRRDRGLI